MGMNGVAGNGERRGSDPQAGNRGAVFE